MYHFDAFEMYDGEKYEFAVAVQAANLLEAEEQIRERYPEVILKITDIHEIEDYYQKHDNIEERVK